ncbi:MAG: mechanosensitive ion channel protein MscS, partial [Cyanobacteria bacterium J06649_11]
MRSKPKKLLAKYLKPVKAVIIILMLAFSLYFTPALAQSNKSASVAIDGTPIFRVGTTEKISAKERAGKINQILQKVVESEKSPEDNIEIREQGQYAKIYFNGIDGSNSFTVTDKDLLPEYTSTKEQAEEWKQLIKEKIQKARQERSEEFIRNTLALSSILIILTIALHFILGKVWEILQRNVSPLLTSEDSSDQNQQQKSLNILLKATLFLTRAALWVGVVLYITNLFPVTRQWSYNMPGNIQ